MINLPKQTKQPHSHLTDRISPKIIVLISFRVIAISSMSYHTKKEK